MNRTDIADDATVTGSGQGEGAGREKGNPSPQSKRDKGKVEAENRKGMKRVSASDSRQDEQRTSRDGGGVSDRSRGDVHPPPRPLSPTLAGQQFNPTPSGSASAASVAPRPTPSTSKTDALKLVPLSHAASSTSTPLSPGASTLPPLSTSVPSLSRPEPLGERQTGPSSSGSFSSVPSNPHARSVSHPHPDSKSASRPRTTSTPKSSTSGPSTIRQIPPFQTSSIPARRIPNVNVVGGSPEPVTKYSALFTVRKDLSRSSYELFAQARKEIRSLADSGGLQLELELESTTLPLLRQARLPTSRSSLEVMMPHMKRLAVPGIIPEDYLATFQAWHAFILNSGDATFPICGPTVAAFLSASTRLESGQRPKIVWILEQYRKCTIVAFDGLGRDPQLRKKLEKEWGNEDWAAWERFVELAKIKLGDWKIIEQLAPPVPAQSSTESNRSTPTSSRHTSPALVSDSAPFAPQKALLHGNPSHKALGKRRADDVGPHLSDSAPTSAFTASNPAQDDQVVAPYGYNRYGQPRQKPFKKRKLPPEEQKADEEFYVAVQECMSALVAAKMRMNKKRIGPTQHWAQSMQPEPIEPPSLNQSIPPAPVIVPSTVPPSPYSDYTPSFPAPGAPASEPVLALTDLPPLIALSVSLPTAPHALHLSTNPLAPDPVPLTFCPTTKLLIRDPSIAAPLARFNLTPHQFLPYPQSLTLCSNLSRSEQDKTYEFAKGLEGHPRITRLEQRLSRERVERDTLERKKKTKLEKIVKEAIAEGKPVDLWIDTDEGLMEPREPDATRFARERAQRNGFEPIYCFPSKKEKASRNNRPRDEDGGVRSVEGPTGAEDVPQLVSGKGEEPKRAETVARKGKRKAPDGDVEGGESRQSPPESIQLVETPDPPLASPSTAVQPSHSAPVVPTVSISTPVTDPADSLPLKGAASPSTSTSSTVLKPSALQARRPSLTTPSLSAPVVPQQLQRPRSKSTSQEPPTKMRRRTSITGSGSGGIHPLAHLYASQSPQYRQGARLKAATIVAATKQGIIPASKSPLIAAKVLAEGAVLPRGSPRISMGGSSLAKSPRVQPKPLSPPLVPIPLEAEKENETQSRDGGGGAETKGSTSDQTDSMDVDSNATEDSFERLHPPSISSSAQSSALGVILELPSPQPAPASISSQTPRRADDADAQRDQVPPIPVPELELAQDSIPGPLPSNSSPAQSQTEPLPTATPTDVPVVRSAFSRLVRRLSSSVGRLVGGSPPQPSTAPVRSSPSSSTMTPLVTADGSAPAPSPALLEPGPDETPPLEPSPATSKRADSSPSSKEPSSTDPVIVEGSSLSLEGKEQDVEVPRGSDALSSSDHDHLSSAPQPLASPQSAHVGMVETNSSRPISKEEDKEGKGKAVEIVPEPSPQPILKKDLKDHPLRHVSKRVLVTSDPIFPFERVSP